MECCWKDEINHFRAPSNRIFRKLAEPSENMTVTRTKYPTWTRSILIEDLLGLQVLQEKSLREDSEARYKAENGCSASQCGSHTHGFLRWTKSQWKSSNINSWSTLVNRGTLNFMLGAHQCIPAKKNMVVLRRLSAATLNKIFDQSPFKGCPVSCGTSRTSQKPGPLSRNGFSYHPLTI